MKMENRLCGETGEAVVAEFGFKGDFESVKQQLWSLMDDIRKKGLKESDRNELFVRHQRLLKHQLEQDNNPYLVKYNAIRKQGLEKAIKILDAMRKSKENLHKSKECLCFNNS
jgi:flagellar motor component MotA